MNASPDASPSRPSIRLNEVVTTSIQSAIARKSGRQEIHGDARRAEMHEEREPHRGDEDRNGDLENELVDVMEAPQIVDDAEEKDEKAARDQHGGERLLDRAAGKIEEEEREEREEDRADDPDAADMRDIPARAPVRLLADPQTRRHAPDERREQRAEREGQRRPRE